MPRRQAGRPQCSGCRAKGYKPPIAICSGVDGKGLPPREDGRAAVQHVPPQGRADLGGADQGLLGVRQTPAVRSRRAPSSRCAAPARHVPSRREPCAFCGKLAIAAARTPAGAECSHCRARRLRSKITCSALRAHRHDPRRAGRMFVSAAPASASRRSARGCGAEEHELRRRPVRPLLAAAPAFEELERTGDPAAIAALAEVSRRARAMPPTRSRR